ncbi:MAG TPA: hypothetical protein VFN35_28195 [Ktedonobacteraceae bacterium]|nr:hypothetical protein [Ktedonobacteraceae bacterium]
MVASWRLVFPLFPGFSRAAGFAWYLYFFVYPLLAFFNNEMHPAGLAGGICNYTKYLLFVLVQGKSKVGSSRLGRDVLCYMLFRCT